MSIRTLERLTLFAVAAALTTLLHYYGDLPFPAALLIGFALTIITLWLYALHDLAAFEPYRLTIGINYAALWEDFRLIPAEGPKFENYTFTALTAVLFARSDERGYSTNLDIYKEVPCAGRTWQPGVGELTDRPTFFLRQVHDGYQFGLRVQSEWWSQQPGRLDPAVSQHSITYDGTLVLGKLPRGYIPDHVRRWDKPVSIFDSFDRKQERWTVRLRKDGWLVDNEQPQRIEHRYLVLWFHAI